MNKKEQALALAEAGHPVFPLNGKTPVAGCLPCSQYIYPNGTKVRNPDYQCKHGRSCPCVAAGNPNGNTCHSGYAGTTNATVVARWWTLNPDYNIGYHLADWQYVIYDVDPRNGGWESLEEVERIHGAIPAVKVVETAGGGLHLYVENPSRNPVQRGWAAVGTYLLGRTSQKTTGIDIKAGPGFYVVAEGSEVDGNVYTVTSR